MQQTERASFAAHHDGGSDSQVKSSASFKWRDKSLSNRSVTMKAVRNCTMRLAWSLTLTVAALLLPPSIAQAGQGHGGHGVWGGSGRSLHHGHYGLPAGYGGTGVGFYPYWGYESFYVYGGYPAYVGYGGNLANEFDFGGYTPFWGVPAASSYTNFDFINAIDFFR
jgi:hypothetical protein